MRTREKTAHLAQILSDNLRIYMRQNGISRYRLSRDTGINSSQIWNYLNHRRIPSLGISKILADSIGCQVDDLVTKDFFVKKQRKPRRPGKSHARKR